MFLVKLVPFVRHTSARIAISPICRGHIDQRIKLPGAPVAEVLAGKGREWAQERAA